MRRLARLRGSNFRSLRGEFDVDLDADVVLIHGQNGSGKTSVMSAIELALTGEVATLKRYSAAYEGHLLYAGTKLGLVELTVRDDSGAARVGRWELSPSGVRGQAVYNGDDARYVAERAYLAQSSLGRLIEIYDESDRKGDSALTRFVNDLLGLDGLDRLIDGLDAALDVRRLRRYVPEYGALESSIEFQADQVRRAEEELARLESTAPEMEVAIALPPESAVVPTFDGGYLELQTIKSRLGQIRVELETATRASTSDGQILEQELATLSASLDEWAEVVEPALLAVFEGAQSVLGTDLSLSTSAPLALSAVTILRDALTSESRRAATRLAQHRAALVAHAENQRELATLLLAIGPVESAIADVTANPRLDELLAALVAIAPLSVGPICPVCSRDYREVSEHSLQDHVVQQIETFGQLAEQLRTLTAQRAEIQSAIQGARAAYDRSAGDVLDDPAVAELEARAASLDQTLARLATLEPASRGVYETSERHRQVASEIARSQSSLATLVSLRSELVQIDHELHPDQPPAEAGELAVLLSKTSELVDGLLSQEHLKLAAATEEKTARSRIDAHEQNVRAARDRLRQLRRTHKTMRSALAAAKSRMMRLRTLSTSAVDVRAAIVSKVFDESLNQTWKDLFARLAPSEPFLPEFVRGGDRSQGVNVRVFDEATRASGAPGMMLSSGNLNTAALTLFLSLNLTAGPRVPLLMLDDPVQAMDDVHVAQFAALLRAVARDLGRQLFVSVHEKALFDYLALELAPSEPGESLMKVQLVRGDGPTEAQSTLVEWAADPVTASLRAL